MPYGTIKVDTVTFTDSGVDKSVSISGLVQNPTFSGNVTVTGTISGVTVTGTTASFTSGNFTNISVGTYTITSGVFSAGSETNPSITFTGDLNTGIYSPGADQVAISTGGTGRLFVDANGRISVGGTTVTDSNLLNIQGSTATHNVGVVFNKTNGTPQVWGIQNGGSLNFFNYTASSTALTIDTSNRVGVGTSSPGTILDIVGAGNPTLTIRGSDGAYSGFINIQSAGGGSSVVNATGGTNALTFQTNSSERLRIDSSGRVGIGTSSPSTTLHVVGTGLFTGSTQFNNGIQLKAATQNYIYFDDALSFTRNGVGDRLTIDSSGRVGIGTTTVDDILHLKKAGDLYLRVENSSTNVIAYFGQNSSGTYIGNGATGSDIRFLPAGTERARLTTSGQLLVGTSSSSATVGAVFQDNSGSTGPGHVLLATSASAPTSAEALGRLRFSAANHVESVQIEASRDGGTWTAGSSQPSKLTFSTTADGASSPTERMRIAQNGVITIQNGAVAVIGTLTDGATITPDFAADCNFTITLGGNRTIANPTNITAGQSGSIFIVQDATGSRTLSWGSSWDFPGGTAPTLSTAANAVDRIDYIVRSSTSIHTVFTANYS